MLRLPEEIQVDVFLRLPAKSILRLRCVCKPFCRLLYDPKFIKDHLNRNKINPNLMLIYNEPHVRHECCSIHNASILSSSALSTKCTCDGAIRRYNPNQSAWVQGVRIVGSCNGLICLNINEGSRFCIWNPSTEEYTHYSLFDDFSSSLTFGFGYDCHLDVYKLMRVVADDPGYCYNGYSQVRICTLRGNNNVSWKTIQTMKRYYFFPEHPTGHLAVWFLNGALHWKGYTMPTSSWVIVSLDISTDRLVEFVYPEVVNPTMYGIPPDHMVRFDHLGILEDRLCLVVYDTRIRSIDVWLMQDYGVSDSWTKRYSLNLSCTLKFPLGKLIQSFSTKDGRVILLIDGGYNKLLYDPKNDSIKFLEVPIFGNDRTACSLLVSYVDSLVSLKSRATERNANEMTKKQRLK